MARWNIRYGPWWMIQWTFDWWFSLGVHIDLRQRIDRKSGVRYGPYLDLHLGCVIASFGRKPAYSGELERVISVGRGGEFFGDG